MIAIGYTATEQGWRKTSFFGKSFQVLGFFQGVSVAYKEDRTQN